MSLLAKFKDLVLGPQHVNGTNWHDLFLNLHIDLQGKVALFYLGGYNLTLPI